eukprot:1644-Heterococcus_DN1.PRE.2
MDGPLAAGCTVLHCCTRVTRPHLCQAQDPVCVQAVVAYIVVWCATQQCQCMLRCEMHAF